MAIPYNAARRTFVSPSRFALINAVLDMERDMLDGKWAALEESRPAAT